jgi:hypothetical protein
MSSIVKIAVILLYLEKTYGSLYYIGFRITVIVSVVEGGIPNGGYIGEILAISVYGFPMEQALPRYDYRNTDPMATLLNANGDLVSASNPHCRGKNGCRRK